MCDNICGTEKKYALGAVPYFPLPPAVKAYPCQAVEVDTPIYEPLVKPVIKNIVQETTINVPKIEYRENIVEVPKVEYRPYPVIKDVETPIYQDKYTYKDVQVPQKKYRIKPIYKTVDVPEVEYVDKYVKKKYKRFKYVPKEVQIPFRPRKEVYTEVPVARYIPQHMESVIQPDPLVAPIYHGEVPTYKEYTGYPVDAIYPVVTRKESKQNKCCLSSLFCKKEEKYEIVPPVIQPQLPLVDFQNNIYSSPPMATCYSHQIPLTPSPYDIIGYSHPFIVEEKEEENDICATIIETTANVLAASGVALILAGKLTFDGISYLVKLSNKGKINNNVAAEIEDSQETENQISSSHTPSTYSLESSVTTVEAS